MISRDEIAAKATPAFRYPLELSFSDGDVAVAARTVEAATTLVDLKVLAYANHIGAMTSDEARRRLGEPRAVVDALRSLLKSLGVVDQSRLTEALSGGAAGYSGPATANDQREGWALTLFDLLHQSKLPNWHTLFDADDPARIGIRWALQGVLNRSEATTVMRSWAAKGDALHIAAAGILVLDSVEQELAGVSSMIEISALDRLPRAVIGGRVLATLLQRHRNPNLRADWTQRLDDVITRLKADVAVWTQSPKDLRTFIDSGKRNEEDLISFLLTLPLQSRARNAVEREADNLLRRAFQRVETRAELEERQLMYVAGLMINPLGHAAIEIRLSLELFTDLLDNLAFDEYAHGVDYALYLNDRVRAILLCAIGGITAVVNNESALGTFVREAADTLVQLPPGSVAVFTDDVIAQLKSDFGVTLPAK